MKYIIKKSDGEYLKEWVTNPGDEKENQNPVWAKTLREALQYYEYDEAEFDCMFLEGKNYDVSVINKFI